ncbi:uncharacterized protein [Procambarus clarkii]|uniref:uncharacterized protein n=1 Tax=Procambarus clarkii TaxID=6728 RepID=UPI00374430D8
MTNPNFSSKSSGALIYFSSTPMSRVLVTFLQISGIFVYTWPRSPVPCRPSLSLPLCFWALFFRILMVCATYLYIAKVQSFTTGMNIGTFSNNMTWAATAIAGSLAQFTFLFKNKTFAELYEEFDKLPYREDDGDQPSKMLLLIRITISCSTMIVFLLQRLPEKSHDPYFIGLLCLCLFFMYGQSISLSILLKNKLKFLAKVVHRSTEETVEQVASIRQTMVQVAFIRKTADQVFSTQLSRVKDHDIDHLLLPLVQLEEKIGQVELLKAKTVECFYSSVTLVLGAFIVATITGIFSCFTDFSHNYNMVPNLIAFFFIMINLCYTGQMFTDKINESIWVLRQLSMSTKVETVKASIHRIIGYLQHLGRLDMKGWYSLNVSTLVSLLSFMATYLVILLQVGWQRLDT